MDNVNNVSSVFFGQNLMTWIIGAFGLYLLYSAITGKGSIYKNDHVKKEYVSSYKRITRIFALISGLLCAAMTIIDLLLKGGNVWVMVMVGLALAVIVAFIVIMRPMMETRRRK